MNLGSSKSSLFAGSTLTFGFERNKDKDEKTQKEDSDKEKSERTKKLPIINPLVRLPTWPSK